MAGWPVRWLLLAWLFAMPLCAHACVLACFAGFKRGWLLPSSRTPCVRYADFTTYPNNPLGLKEREEHEIERGRERERVMTCSVGFWQAVWQAVGWQVALFLWLVDCLFAW